jgi:hypothetical protein
MNEDTRRVVEKKRMVMDQKVAQVRTIVLRLDLRINTGRHQTSGKPLAPDATRYSEEREPSPA